MAASHDSVFDQREIPCANSEAARAEAERQQRLEPEPEQAEWIYLRNQDRQWVARRTLRNPVPSRSFRRALLDGVVKNLHLEDLFLR